MPKSSPAITKKKYYTKRNEQFGNAVNREYPGIRITQWLLVLGKPVELLIPFLFRDNHPVYRSPFFNNPKTIVMGAGRDLFAKRKDNSEFPVEISQCQYRSNDEDFVIAFVVDITFTLFIPQPKEQEGCK